MEKIYEWFDEKLNWRKEETDQNILVAGILLFVLTAVVLFVLFTPGVKYYAEISGRWLLKTLVYVFGGVFLVLGPWFCGHFGVRTFIEYADSKRASNIDLKPLVHWLLNITLSVATGWLWTYVVLWTISIPSYLQTLFLNWGWYNDGSIQGTTSWFLVGSLAFFFGYFWRGIKSEFFSSYY